MKKSYHHLNFIKLTFIFLFIATIVQAQKFKVDQLYYEVTTGNNVAVVSEKDDYPYWDTKPAGDITIPEAVTYESTTYNVTSIGEWAFSYCDGLTTVTIPNSVTNIGEWAFIKCTGLTEIVVESSNPNFSSEDGVLFNKNKTNLIQYAIGKTNNSYIIPNSITNISKWAFYECTGLTEITIGNSVTNIGEWAFIKCTGLTEITIGNSVTDIGEGAFYKCTGLTTVTIPNSVTNIGDGAFSYCTGLTEINIEDGNVNYSFIDGVLFNKNKTKLIVHLSGKPGSYTYTIPNSITNISKWAFSGCTGLTEITIGNSVTNIGKWAFAYCSKLDTIRSMITEPNSDSLGNDVFFNVPKDLCILKVPTGSKSKYEVTEQWNEFANIVEDASLVSVKEDEKLITEFKLKQNYPNPFNPSTVINYELPESGKVVLEVYNSIGEKIATLVNKKETKGVHKVTFSAQNLPSGLYFYRISYNNKITTKKMLLLK